MAIAMKPVRIIVVRAVRLRQARVVMMADSPETVAPPMIGQYAQGYTAPKASAPHVTSSRTRIESAFIVLMGRRRTGAMPPDLSGAWLGSGEIDAFAPVPEDDFAE